MGRTADIEFFEMARKAMDGAVVPEEDRLCFILDKITGDIIQMELPITVQQLRDMGWDVQ